MITNLGSFLAEEAMFLQINLNFEDIKKTINKKLERLHAVCIPKRC
jgi:hypothetical protein